MKFLKAILDQNQLFEADLADSQFVSCGSGCRQFKITSVSLGANVPLRASLAWQGCISAPNGSVTSLPNDLDLVLDCGSSLQTCGGTTTSNATDSETEMIHRSGCLIAKSCSLYIRIKNGVSLAPCGSTTTERVGVAWSYQD
jgi:hypothetical protein